MVIIRYLIAIKSSNAVYGRNYGKLKKSLLLQRFLGPFSAFSNFGLYLRNHLIYGQNFWGIKISHYGCQMIGRMAGYKIDHIQDIIHCY